MVNTQGVNEWSALEGWRDWGALIVGNGSSINVWGGFSYSSLFDVAATTQLLSQTAVDLFSEFSTTNFEEVLWSIATASRVQQARKKDTKPLAALYDETRLALGKAVQQTHVPWEAAQASGTLKKIGDCIGQYRTIFSLNYDLLLYWGLMEVHGDAAAIKDYFWNDPFDRLDAEVWNNDPSILFVHGGLHLYRTPDGHAHKRKSKEFENILDQFSEPLSAQRIPLLVTEGDSTSKLRSINSSDYLNFAYEQLVRNPAPTVVFGASLGPSDAHIVDAMRKWGRRSIAVSLHLPEGADAVALMKEWGARLPYAELWFFDASTHVLGDPGLRVG